MEWTDIRLTVSKTDAEAAEAVATMIAEGGIYIEDYSDIEEQVEQIAHVDLIEQELLDKPRDTVIIHMYLEPGASPVETLALIAARMEAAGIPYTSETEGVEQEDWQNGWRKYYHPMDVGQRLAIVPSWQDYDTDRVKLILDPGLAFGTGGHETTNLCLEYCADRKKLGAKTLFATHYHELTVMQDLLDGVKNYSIAVKKRGDDITFLRRIIPGGADDSFGIEVAKLAGLPNSIINRAKEILKELESGSNAPTVIKEKSEDMHMSLISNHNPVVE